MRGSIVFSMNSGNTKYPMSRIHAGEYGAAIVLIAFSRSPADRHPSESDSRLGEP
jgi:hypothetical protein